MTQAGGPAAINGFLYQIIHHLGWLAELTLSGTLDGQDVENACLVLEPRNGGDARAEAPGVYLVEQYKTRSGRTWSLKEVEDVLSDLRKAIAPSQPSNARYRFVTDGRAGKLTPFTTFLADLRSVAGPDELDNSEEKAFRKGVIVTNRAFFDHIVDSTRHDDSWPIAAQRTAVFHLLSCFEMEFESSGEARANDVEQLLRRYSPDLGDERKIREHLIGVLIGELSKGEAKLDVIALQDVFEHVGVNPERLIKLASIAETMGSLTSRRLARLQYQRDTDVRSIPDWPNTKQVLLIAGEGGAGKTWQLGRLLEARAESRHITTLVHGRGSTQQLLSLASQDIWQVGLGETSERTLVAVSNILRKLLPEPHALGLTVAFDDVQDVDTVRDLIRQDWIDWGICLALTVPQSVARSIKLTDSGTVHVHDVKEFSVNELDALLQKGGWRWADLPEDLRGLLRKPILASLFLALPYTSFQGAPRSEYEIFDAFWQRIAAKGRPGDEGIVIALADRLREGKSYPLPRPAWHEIGLSDNEALLRLEASGWLRSDESGEISFAHDRLLNWALAKSLVRRLQRKEISVEDIGNFLVGKGHKRSRRLIQQLGYLPMDTLWLLAIDKELSEPLSQLIVQFEESQEFGSYGRNLYVQHLPTLGRRAVPVLFERLRSVTSESDGDYRISLIGKALAKLACQESVEFDDAIESLLSSMSRERQVVAIDVLTASPDPKYLDRLWEIHRERLSALEDKTGGSSHLDYRASFAALLAAVEKDPKWLRNRILTPGEEHEPYSELAYLLHRLEHPDAPSIWQATNDVLMTKVSSHKPRSLIYCIARFSDMEKIGFVIKHLSCSDDFASGAALEALAVMDPVTAIDRLVEAEDWPRYLARNRWLPVLLCAHPELVRKRIYDLAKSHPTGRRMIEEIFWERPDELDEKMLRFLLRMLEKDLSERLDDATTADADWLFHPLDFLRRIARPELLAVLAAEANSQLEHMLTGVVSSRLNKNSRSRDHILENGRRVLMLFGGSGIATLINSELESEHALVRENGLQWAYTCTDDGIVEKLWAIARRSVPSDSNGKLESQPYSEFHRAITALTALGPDELLVEALWNSGITAVPPDLPDLRAHRGSISKVLTERAVRTMESVNPPEELLITALLVAWLSADKDLISVVRTVFSRVEPESATARYACIALQALGDKSQDFARLAMDLALSEENARWGVNALISLGDRGLEMLAEWLRNQGTETRLDYVGTVVRVLYENQETRSFAIETAASFCVQAQFLNDPPYDIAAEANDHVVREQVFSRAFSARSFSATPIRAIEGLAKFDSPRAIEAIELALQSHPNIERELCLLLVRIVPETAAAKLVNIVNSIDRKSLRRTVGRVLRRLDPGIVGSLVVEQLSSAVAFRRIAAELAGWLVFPEIKHSLEKTAAQDGVAEVRDAALASLEQHSREKSARTLLADFPSAAIEQQWIIIVTVLELADPYLLTDSEDVLWLGAILTEDVDFSFTHYAESALRRRKQKKDV